MIFLKTISLSNLTKLGVFICLLLFSFCEIRRNLTGTKFRGTSFSKKKGKKILPSCVHGFGNDLELGHLALLFEEDGYKFTKFFNARTEHLFLAGAWLLNLMFRSVLIAVAVFASQISVYQWEILQHLVIKLYHVIIIIIIIDITFIKISMLYLLSS